MGLRLMLIVSLLLLSEAQKWPVTGDCQPCRCYYKMTSFGRLRTVNCSRRGLSSVPANLPTDLMALDLSWNSLNVQQLSRELCKFQSLQSLSLTFNDLNTLSTILRGCSSVLELNLTGNRLSQVDSKTFQGLRNLRRLLGLEVESVVSRQVFKDLINLKDLDLIFHGKVLPKGLFDDLVINSLNLVVTQSPTLPKGLFQFGLKTLNTLQLIGERVTELNEGLLDGLSVLRKLFLVMPVLQKLPEHFFHGQQIDRQSQNAIRFANLQEVEITGVRVLPAKLFNYLTNLETLQLKEISVFPEAGFLVGAVNLRKLEITGSKLTRIPVGWFSQLYSLKTLKLSSNQLEELREGVFKGLLTLNYLDLSYNNLEGISGKTLQEVKKTLETLILGSNYLTEISDDCLSGLTSLRFLDVSENRLTNVYTSSFVGMTYLSVLYLHNNRLTSLPKDLFRDLNHLESLSLADNYLVEFPQAILQLNGSLINLDLASNELRAIPAYQLCDFEYLESVTLTGNYLHCDCSLLAFHQCLETTVQGQCSTPQEYADQDLREVKVPDSCTARNSGLRTPPRPHSTDAAREEIQTTSDPARAVENGQKATQHQTSVTPTTKAVGSDFAAGSDNMTIVRQLFTEDGVPLRQPGKSPTGPLSGQSTAVPSYTEALPAPSSADSLSQIANRSAGNGDGSPRLPSSELTLLATSTSDRSQGEEQVRFSVTTKSSNHPSSDENMKVKIQNSKAGSTDTSSMQSSNGMEITQPLKSDKTVQTRGAEQQSSLSGTNKGASGQQPETDDTASDDEGAQSSSRGGVTENTAQSDTEGQAVSAGPMPNTDSMNNQFNASNSLSHSDLFREQKNSSSSLQSREGEIVAEAQQSNKDRKSNSSTGLHSSITSALQKQTSKSPIMTNADFPVSENLARPLSPQQNRSSPTDGVGQPNNRIVSDFKHKLFSNDLKKFSESNQSFSSSPNNSQPQPVSSDMDMDTRENSLSGGRNTLNSPSLSTSVNVSNEEDIVLTTRTSLKSLMTESEHSVESETDDTDLLPHEKEGREDNGEDSADKKALNFTISAVVALLVFACALLAIYAVRRWQHKGSYILHSFSSQYQEMTHMDAGMGEHASDLNLNLQKWPSLEGKPIKC